jgi:hypothetical protein
MSSFLGYLKSQPPEFWITALLIGIGGSWLSAYLVRWSDRLSRSVSRRWGERTEAKAAARNREFERLRANPQEQVMARLDSLDDKISGIFGVAAGTAVMLIADFMEPALVLRIIGLLVVLLGMQVHQRGVNRALVVKEARQ